MTLQTGVSANSDKRGNSCLLLIGQTWVKRASGKPASYARLLSESGMTFCQRNAFSDRAEVSVFLQGLVEYKIHIYHTAFYFTQFICSLVTIDYVGRWMGKQIVLFTCRLSCLGSVMTFATYYPKTRQSEFLY